MAKKVAIVTNKDIIHNVFSNVLKDGGEDVVLRLLTDVENLVANILHEQNLTLVNLHRNSNDGITSQVIRCREMIRGYVRNF